ncbi:MAG: AAA family ATPase [Cyclobacteriaceae bacterium]|jgi:ATP-dependent RNA/DNA helicase IGHMBP2|nr:AAA family ATPase [Cyclobacteriaceae bacterium]
MTSKEQLLKTLELIKLERQTDLEQYRQKVLQRSLTHRVRDGVTWYPIRLIRDYIGMGERIILELQRINQLDQPHSFQSGKLVSLFCNASGKPEKEHTNAVINYVQENTITITLNSEDLPDWINDGQLGLDVMFDEMTYKEMEHAVKSVIKAEGNRVAELREIFLGDIKNKNTTSGFKPENTVDYQESINVLNESQKKAVDRILQTQDVAFIHGPPGTGKTTTLVQAIVLTHKIEGQVLVCTPSNAAIDLLVEKLSQHNLNVVRIGHPARVTEQTLSKTLDARIATHSNFAELRNLRKKMEQVRNQASKYKRNFGYNEKEQRRLLKEEARTLKSDADMLEFYIINDLLQKADVICSTLVGSSHPVIRGRKFKTVFIDEAAQSLEPACWIPLLKSERAILAGDHCQLPPTIKSNEAAKGGLALTLFEKGIAKHPDMATMLQVQYRMHESIMKFSSTYFYNDELIAHASVKTELLRPNQTPIEFIDTAGCGYSEQQDPETLSRFNIEEANLLIRQVEKLVEEIGLEEWIANEISMGIITPYRAQVDHLHKLAEASHLLEPLHKLITINTVDAFQGQERDVIAISFVRSNEKAEVGFLGDIRRTNVAMTRARKKLILIGDSATLGSHPFYVELLEYVQGLEFYHSAFEV